jgi:hypothetical protein
LLGFELLSGVKTLCWIVCVDFMFYIGVVGLVSCVVVFAEGSSTDWCRNSAAAVWIGTA